MGNIKKGEIVNPTAEMYAAARRLEDDPELILALVDLLFLGQDSTGIPS